MSCYLLCRNSNYDHVIILIMILKHDFFLIWQKWASTDTRVAELEQWKVSEQLGCTLLIYLFIFVFFLQRLELAMEHFVLLPQRAFGALTFCEQVRMFSTLCTDWHSNMEHINIKSYSIFQQHARVVLMCYTLFCNEYALLTFSILFYPILFLVKDCCCCYIIYKFKCCKILWLSVF